MTDLVDLEIPPRSDHLALVRLVVTAAAAVHGRLTDRRIDDLRLAVSEACAQPVDAVPAADGDGRNPVRNQPGDPALAAPRPTPPRGLDPAPRPAHPPPT